MTQEQHIGPIEHSYFYFEKKKKTIGTIKECNFMKI